jgi:hypothetical protein
MNEHELKQVEIQFRAKPQAKARKALMLFVFAVLAGWIVLSGMRSGFDAALLAAVGVTLILFCVVFTVQRVSSPRDSEVVITLTASTIETERFTTVEKKFLWTEILGGRVYRYEGSRYLELRVTATLLRHNRFSLAEGVNSCAPVFPLHYLGSDDQEKLLALIREKTTLHS